MSLKEFLGKFFVTQAGRPLQPSKSSVAISSDELGAVYERLKAATIGDEALLKDLDELKGMADSGLQLSWWHRRFMFGFGVAKAVEDWFHAFDSVDSKQPLHTRIPRRETANVAAKWAWFGVFSTVISVVFSLAVAGITAIFLYKQTNILAQQAAKNSEQVAISRETSTNAQRTQYTQILYDEKCKTIKAESESFADEPETKEACAPVYNFRIRTEAAKALLKLERTTKPDIPPDFRGAHLEHTSLSNIDFSDTDLSRANLSGADLTDANLRGATLSKAVFREAILDKADLTDANLTEADFTKATIIAADLIGANLSNTVFRDSDLWCVLLSDADMAWTDFSEASLYGLDFGSQFLGKAKLNNTRITNTNFSEAVLDYVDLSGANLIGSGVPPPQSEAIVLDNIDRNSRYSRCRFQGYGFQVQNATQQLLDNSCGDKNTKLPEGLSIQMCSQVDWHKDIHGEASN